MRKLTVKNFSVIKDAELEFGKITVLIGPQSSGKSLLCKLAYFLGRKVLDIAIDQVVGRRNFEDFIAAVSSEFIRWFPVGGWGEKPWSMCFKSGSFEISLTATPVSEALLKPAVTVGPVFRLAYETRLRETHEEQEKRGFLIAPALQSLAATVLMKVAGHGIWDNSTYIPMERSYFVDTAKGYKALGSESDPIAEQFASIFANAMNSTMRKDRVSRYLLGELVSAQNLWFFNYYDKRSISMRELSSGSKELLPLLVVLDFYEQQRRKSGDLVSAELNGDNLYSGDEFTIEEPESSIFPSTQYELVRELAALANEPDFKPHFLVTTHSPYVLSSFNNLLEAWQAGHMDERRANAVRAVIEENYWVNPDEFRAYAIQDGVLRSIVAEDTRLISENYLDSVSETIGAEFDELLRIGYVEA